MSDSIQGQASEESQNTADEPKHQPKASTVSRSDSGAVFVVAPPRLSFAQRYGSLMSATVLLLLLFYGLPFLLSLITFSPHTKPELFLLVLVNPVTVFIINSIYSALWTRGWILVLLSGALAVPSFYVFYNDSALIYAAFYLIVAALGWLVGMLISKTRKKHN